MPSFKIKMRDVVVKMLSNIDIQPLAANPLTATYLPGQICILSVFLFAGILTYAPTLPSLALFHRKVIGIFIRPNEASQTNEMLVRVEQR